MRWRVCLVLVTLLCLPVLCGAFTIAELQTELNTDPATLGYAPHIASGNDAELVSIINLLRTGAPYQINKGLVAPTAMLKEIVITDLLIPDGTAPIPKWPLLVLYLGRGEPIDAADTDIQNVFLNIFPAGSQSRTNLVAFFKKQGSRAEVLWGSGFVVTTAQVSCALRNAGC